jgi:hypothetical protein
MLTVQSLFSVYSAFTNDVVKTEFWLYNRYGYWLKLIKSFCECILLRSILVMNKNNHHSQYICDFYY